MSERVTNSRVALYFLTHLNKLNVNIFFSIFEITNKGKLRLVSIESVVWDSISYEPQHFETRLNKFETEQEAEDFIKNNKRRIVKTNRYNLLTVIKVIND